MALVNQAKREINAKIVFFGPGMAGKATNLKHIYNKLKPEFRGAMKAMNVQDARMLFFDFTPPGDGSVEGFRVRFHVYTVSGDLVDPAAWKMVLKGADGIVFIGDAAPQRLAANRDSLDKLELYLHGYGQSLSSLPVVFEYNKSDLQDALGTGELDRELNPAGHPSFRASSRSGEGVLQALLGLVKTVLTGLRDRGVEGIVSGEGLQRMVEPAGVPAEETPAPFAREFAVPEAEVPPNYEAAQFETAPFLAAEVEARRAEGEAAPAGISEAVEGALSLEIAGVPEPEGGGRIRIPLVIRSGSRHKSVVLSLALTLEEG
jgi:signal recognition particle receptor subunit beta